MTSAIIVAAGSSQRMGFDKLLADLAGKPVLAHTIAAFEACDDIDEILIITNEDRFEKIRQMESDFGFKKVTHLIQGGAQRHDSVWAGLQKVSATAQEIAVHDGARPLITPAQISNCIQAAKKHQAATSAHPITDTVKRSNAQNQVAESVDRENLWAMETPQVFDKSLLINSYEKVMRSGQLVTDEVSAIDIPTHLVSNSSPNPKITFPGDLATAAKLLD